MHLVKEFEAPFAAELTRAHALLADGQLVVHDAVAGVTLHGSRGLSGGARPDSDIDLCLEVDSQAAQRASDAEALLRQVLATTLQHWEGNLKLDLAAVFDKSGCGLRCLRRRNFDAQLCESTVDCIGLFKTQKGFDGYVNGPFLDMSKMYPLITIWRR